MINGEKMKRVLMLFAVLFLFASNEVLPQSGGLHLMTGIPMGEFKDNMSNPGFGLNLNFNFWEARREMPVTLGVNLGYMIYGTESRREPFSGYAPDVTVNVDRTNNIANFHLLTQIFPVQSTVRPYFEVLVGGSYLFTETKIESRNSGEEVASSTNFDDWAWNYGGGGGIQILLKDMSKSQYNDNEVRLNSLWLDLKVRYLFGSEAEYLKKGSVVIENSKVYYYPSRSATDLMSIHLGVVASF